MILDILNNGIHVDIINKTDFVMIPKKKNLESPLDLRHIRLSNNIYKNCFLKSLLIE